jgi:probable HAF family extracellular repeat protein
MAINDRGQVAGFASNGIADPFSMFGWGTQARAFVWQNGVMRDLGSLGGPDSVAGVLNERGQIAGQSYTSAISNTMTGVPTTDPFLWQDGQMQDLGTLGGTLGFANWLNDRGEVAGQSNLAGDQTFHPFLWTGHTLQDLGTLGGTNGSATWLNDRGEVVGWAGLPGDQTIHAFLWQHGLLRDLGVPVGDTYSLAMAINNRGQVVGNAGSCDSSGCTGNTFLWDRGTMSDLQTLVAPTDGRLTFVAYINDWGEIAALGLLPTGQVHAVLLIPTARAAEEGLTSNAPAPSTGGSAAVKGTRPTYCLVEPRWRTRLVHAPHWWGC